MKTRQICSLTASVLLAMAWLAALPARAQSLAEPVVGVADPDALFTDKDPQLNRNKQAAYHIVKDLLECNQWQDAGKWLTDRYIQHNPMARSGLAGVVAFFTSRNVPPTPVPAKLQKTRIVAVLASGDLVTVVYPRAYPVPGGEPGQTYTSTWFDMWRFVDGKADEHWDPATLPAKSAGK